MCRDVSSTQNSVLPEQKIHHWAITHSRRHTSRNKTGLQCVETVGWRENMTCTVRLWLDFTPCSRNGASPHLTSSLSCANLLYILLELQSHWDLIAHQLAVKSEGTHCAANDCIQNRLLSFLMEPTRDAALFTSHLTVKWLQCKHKYSHISHSLLTFKLH